MNSCSFIVKIITPPHQRFIVDDISVIETLVQFPKVRKKRSFNQFKISIWGNLGKDFIKYYTVGDYIIIEGFLSFERNEKANKYKKETKLTAIKIYPFLLKD